MNATYPRTSNELVVCSQPLSVNKEINNEGDSKHNGIVNPKTLEVIH